MSLPADPPVRRRRVHARAVDLAVGVLAQLMMAGSGLILLPFAVTQLSAPQVGVWYIYLTVQAIVFLLDFGAGQTFNRFFGYVFAGATDLRDDRVPDKSPDGRPDPRLLAALLATARRIYGAMAALAGLLLLTAGTWALHQLTRDSELPEAVWPSWGLFVVTMMAQTYFQWQGPPLMGSGRTRRNYEIAVISRTVQVAVTIGALLIHPSLLTMALGFAVSAVVMRLLYHRALRPIRATVKGADWSPADYAHLPGVVFRSARKLGGIILGIQLASRFIVLAVAWYAGLVVSAQFSITYQALVALNAIAFVAQTMFAPRVAGARVAGDTETMRSLFSLSLVFGWTVFLAGGVVLVTAVPWLLERIGSSTTLPPTPSVLLMLAIFTLEMNLFTSTNMITTFSNTVPYWRAILLAGALTVAAVITVGELGLGLMAILTAQLAIQLAYNHWRWPAHCFGLLGLRPRELPRYVLAGLRRVRTSPT